MYLSWLEIIATLFFIIWLVCSIVFQLKAEIFEKLDIFGLLPSFRFFAPRPVSRDLRVYCKGFNDDEEITNWIPIFKSKKSFWCFIWNPDHRLRKAVFDLYEELEPYRQTPEVWHLSLPYLIFLNSSQNILKDKINIKRVQFTVACFAGFEDETHDLLFISNLHQFD